MASVMLILAPKEKAVGKETGKKKGKGQLQMQEQEQYMRELKAWLDETADSNLEEMAEFFQNRLEGYEEHMSVWKDAYIRMAEYVKPEVKRLLDLGCGTGLELDRIWEKYPNLEVTGVDLSEAMLAKLAQKHPDKNQTLICADYFQYPFEKEVYDMVISIESFHHFKPEKKQKLFQKIYKALPPGGVFLEADYFACCEEEETLLFTECARRRAAFHIPEEQFIHFDTPLTPEHEIELLYQAGFGQVELLECVSGASFVRGIK